MLHTRMPKTRHVHQQENLARIHGVQLELVVIQILIVRILFPYPIATNLEGLLLQLLASLNLL